MNYLFVMPKLVQETGDGYVFPLGIAYVSAAMKKAGFKVFNVNLNHREGTIDEILSEEIKKHDIDVLLTGGLSPQYHMIKAVVEAGKRAKSDLIFIAGGGIISADPEAAMTALEHVQYGVIGEGEQTIVELAECLEQGGDPFGVNGIIYKHDGKWITTMTRADIADLDSIPWPDYEGFDLDKYLDAPSPGFSGLNKGRMVCMLASRSCPYQCSFCFHTNGKKYRKRSWDDFFAELDYLRERYNIDFIIMADELFCPKQEDAAEFARRITPYKMRWQADFRVDRVKPELLPLFKESGIDSMFFGLESTDNNILKSMIKKMTIETMEVGLRHVYEAGIPIYGCFIFGDIEETYETALNTLDWWHKHREYSIHLTLMKPFPGAAIYEHACKTGIIKDRVQYLKDGCPQINISKMNDQEFQDICERIAEAQYDAVTIDNVELISYDPVMGRQHIQGSCPQCGEHNDWDEIKLFSIDYITCSHCGQKFHIPIPQKLRTNLDNNITALLDRYGKVAVWGMTLSVMELFKRSDVLANDNVFPIDIAESKQLMRLYGKKINPPSILNEQEIKVVLIAVPSHGGQILCQVRENHPATTEVLDITQLAGDHSPIPAPTFVAAE